MKNLLKLCHISDLHLSDPRGTSLRNLCNKRLLGYLSWTANRRHEYLRSVLDAARDDIAAQNPDHIAVTGDLTQIGLPEEFAEVEAWLDGLGSPERITVIPGNHDAYVQAPYPETLGRCARWLGPDASPDTRPEFPILRRLDEVALIGVSTALPTGPFIAAGWVGAEQLDRLDARLADLGRDGVVRVVLIHHPPTDGVVPARKALRDAAAFREVIARRGCELILHGHAHETCRNELPTPGGLAPVLGVPATSARGRKPYKRSRYSIYTIRRGDGILELELVSRGWNAETGAFERCEREILTLPTPSAMAT